MNLVKLERIWDETAMKSMRLKARRQCPEHYEEIDRHIEEVLFTSSISSETGQNLAIVYRLQTSQ